MILAGFVKFYERRAAYKTGEKWLAADIKSKAGIPLDPAKKPKAGTLRYHLTSKSQNIIPPMRGGLSWTLDVGEEVRVGEINERGFLEGWKY